jgi:hypothetical protein
MGLTGYRSNSESALQSGGYTSSFHLSAITLRFFFYVLPIICVAVLQNFYIQSLIFAFQRAKSLYKSKPDMSDESDDAEADDVADSSSLWQQRLVCLDACNASTWLALLQAPAITSTRVVQCSSL